MSIINKIRKLDYFNILEIRFSENIMINLRYYLYTLSVQHEFRSKDLMKVPETVKGFSCIIFFLFDIIFII